MEDFSKHLLNTILNLFLDQTNMFAKVQNFHSKIEGEYVQKPLDNQGLKVTLNLIPKSSSLPLIEVIRLEVVHSVKRFKSSSFQFTDINVALNDSSRNLCETLGFVNKFFISAAFISPYINFYNSKSLDLDYLKRKYTLDYKIEYKSSIDLQKSNIISEAAGIKSYLFKRDIENSGSSLNMVMMIHDNLHSVLEFLKNLEIAKVKGYGSGRNVRNRFFSEDNDDDQLNDSRSFRKRGTTKIRSEFEVKHSTDRRNSGLTTPPAPVRPFRLLDEMIMDNLEEHSCEEDDMIPLAELNSEKRIRVMNASSFFTETNFSLKSKNKNSENKESFNDTNFADFDDSPTIDNLYYMASKLRKSMKHVVMGCAEDHSYSSKSNLMQTQGFSLPNRDSSASLSRRGFLTFHK
jgi:hypothetical protein